MARKRTAGNKVAVQSMELAETPATVIWQSPGIVVFDMEQPPGVAAPILTAPAPTLTAPTLTAPVATAPTPATCFTRLVANVKGPIDVALAPCTAIVGPNRAHKTAVLDAIRLALFGRRSNLAGLVPLGATRLGAELSGPGGIRVAFEAPFTDGKLGAERFEAGSKEIQLPDVAMHELIELSDAKAREAIFRRFGAAPDSSAPGGLTPEQTAEWAKALAELHEGRASSPVEAVTLLPSIFRRRKLAAGKDARAAEAEAERLRTTVGDLAPVGAAEVEAAEERLRLAELAARAEGLIRRRQTIQDEVDAFNARLESAPQLPPATAMSATADLDQATHHSEIECRAAEDEEQRDRVLLELLRKLEGISAEAGRCALCNAPGVAAVQSVRASIGAVEVRWKAKSAAVTAAQAEVARMKAAHDAIRRTEGARKAAMAVHADLVATRTRLAAVRAENDAALAALGVDPAIGPAEDAAAIRTELVEMRGRRALLDAIDAQRVLARKHAQRMADLRVLEQEAETRIQDLVQRTKRTAEAAVARYMPPGLAAELLVTDDGSCRWAMIGSDGRTHDRTAACGAELGALTIALGLAWGEAGTPRLLLLDDRDLAGFDPATLRAVLDTIRARVDAGELTQAVIAWSRPEEIPEGWTQVALRTGT